LKSSGISGSVGRNTVTDFSKYLSVFIFRISQPVVPWQQIKTWADGST
jgi:hypothetical protein